MVKVDGVDGIAFKYEALSSNGDILFNLVRADCFSFSNVRIMGAGMTLFSIESFEKWLRYRSTISLSEYN